MKRVSTADDAADTVSKNTVTKWPKSVFTLALVPMYRQLFYIFLRQQKNVCFGSIAVISLIFIS